MDRKEIQDQLWDKVTEEDIASHLAAIEAAGETKPAGGLGGFAGGGMGKKEAEEEDDEQPAELSENRSTTRAGMHDDMVSRRASDDVLTAPLNVQALSPSTRHVVLCPTLRLRLQSGRCHILPDTC